MPNSKRTNSIQPLSKRGLIIAFLIVTVIVTIISLCFFVLPIIMERLRTPEERIAKAYTSCIQSIYGVEISKVGTNGLRMKNGIEALKSTDGESFYYKVKNNTNYSLVVCLGLDENEDLYMPLSNEMTEYGVTYSKAVENSEVPSEFHMFNIDDDFDGAIGLPIGANEYRYYAIFSSNMDKLVATNMVCSVFYSKYKSLNDDEDIFPTVEDTTITDRQLHLADNGKSLVINIEPSSFSYPFDGDNIGRCVRGMLDIPERIRREFSDDWIYSSGTTKETYSWGDYEMSVISATRYDYSTSIRGEANHNVEITIYKN